MIQGKWFAPGTALSAVPEIRKAVFGRGSDALDAESWNVLVWEGETPAATGRIWWRDGAYWLGDIGVLPDKRGLGLGDLVLRLLLYKAQSHAARELRLCCTEETQGFFERLGFHTSGNKSASLELMLEGDRIDLDSCKSCKKENCPRRVP